MPDYAKDIRLNLDAVIARSSLAPADALGAALAAAFAAQAARSCCRRFEARQRSTGRGAGRAHRRGADGHEQRLVSVRRDGRRRRAEDDAAELRMNAYATHGGVERPSSSSTRSRRRSSASASSACGRTTKLLKEDGLTTQQLRDVGRIAAVVNAAAQVLAAQA